MIHSEIESCIEKNIPDNEIECIIDATSSKPAALVKKTDNTYLLITLDNGTLKTEIPE
jgi:hypothetical protein